MAESPVPRDRSVVFGSTLPASGVGWIAPPTRPRTAPGAFLALVGILAFSLLLLPSVQAFCSVVETPRAPPIAVEAGVEVELSEGYAITRIQKVFYNPESIDQTGKLIFPVHQNRFFITALSFTSGKEVLLGKMQDKEAARDAFERAVGEGREASILELDRETVEGTAYRLWVTIPARQHRVVTFQLEEVLDKVGGVYHYRYPLEEERVSNPQKIAISVRIATSRALETLEIPSHSLPITKTTPSEAKFKLEAKPGEYDRDLVVKFAPVGEGAPSVRKATFNGEHYWSAAVQPPADLAANHARKVLFLLDRSGSSQRTLPEEVWRPSVERALATLRPGDFVNLGVFSSRAEFALNGFHPATSEVAAKLVEFARSAKVGGSTNLQWSLKQAGELLLTGSCHLPPVLVLLTDGAWTSGDEGQHTVMDWFHDLMMSRGVHPVLVTGVGRSAEVHPVDEVGAMFRGLPSARLADDQNALAEQLRGAPVPLIHDVRVEGVSWPTGKVVVSGGSIAANSELVLLGRGGPPTGGAIVLRGTSQHSLWGERYEVPLATAVIDPMVPKIWALRSVEQLLRVIAMQGEDEDLVTELKRVANEFSIVTPYTSLLVVAPPPHGAIPSPGIGAGGAAGPASESSTRGLGAPGGGGAGLASPFYAAGGVFTPWILYHRHGWQAQEQKSGEERNPFITEGEVDLRLAEGTAEAAEAREGATLIQDGQFVDVVETSDGRIAVITDEPHYHSSAVWAWSVDIFFTILLFAPFLAAIHHHRRVQRKRRGRQRGRSVVSRAARQRDTEKDGRPLITVYRFRDEIKAGGPDRSGGRQD